MTMNSMAPPLGSVAGAADLQVQLELLGHRQPGRAPLLHARFDTRPVAFGEVGDVVRLAGVDVQVEVAVDADALEVQRAEPVLALARRVPVDVRDERVAQPAFWSRPASRQQERSKPQRAAPHQRSTMATARVQPAEAPRIFTGKQAIVKPWPGSASRLCSFSR